LPNRLKLDELVAFLSSGRWTEMTELPKGSPPTFKTIVPLAGGRSQLVFIQINDFYFQLSSPFAKEKEFTANRAFQVNQTLFGLDILFGRYSLVMPGQIESFSADNFPMAVLGIAVQADAVEERIGGGDSL